MYQKFHPIKAPSYLPILQKNKSILSVSQSSGIYLQTPLVYKEEQSIVHLRSIDFQYFKDINVSSLTQYY